MTDFTVCLSKSLSKCKKKPTVNCMYDRIFFICLIKSSCCSRIKKKKEKNPYQFFFPEHKSVKFHFRLGTIPRKARDGNNRAMTSIQERKFCDFSIPQFFFVCRGRKLCGSKL